MISKQMKKWILLTFAWIVLPGAVVLSQDLEEAATNAPLDAATPPLPGGGGDAGTDVPFDGGVSLLVAAGIGYGIKKRYDAKKKNAAVWGGKEISKWV